MAQLILLSFLVFAAWLIRRDIARREGVSAAIWIPTIWVAILASRPVSMWLGSGGGIDPLEGSPLDGLIFFFLILAALAVLARRRPGWSVVFSRNWPIFLFYAYFLISVIWSDSPIPSFKRWSKDFGNIFVALVILTEANPEQAFRAVFNRCAYVLLPLSIIFIRYFPDMGRRYSQHSGAMEATGVTIQKNSLGALVLICGLVLLWDWLERSRPGEVRQDRAERYLPLGLFGIGAWLIYLSDSKTSLACLVAGGLIIAAARLPYLRNRVGALGVYVLVGAVGFYVANWMFGVSESLVSSMGRDMTFTGRTDVWNALLALKTDPIFGTGFCSIWSDQRYLAKLPDWVSHSAHNGYLETYLDGGWVGIFFLTVMLLAVGLRMNRQLLTGEIYALVRFAVYVATLIGNFSESHFGRMSPLGFMFLLVALERPAPAGVARAASNDAPAEEPAHRGESLTSVRLTVDLSPGKTRW